MYDSLCRLDWPVDMSVSIINSLDYNNQCGKASRLWVSLFPGQRGDPGLYAYGVSAR